MAFSGIMPGSLPKKIKKIPVQGSNGLFVLYKGLFFKRNDFGILLERIQQIKTV
jgi:hypothetical protein